LSRRPSIRRTQLLCCTARLVVLTMVGEHPRQPSSAVWWCCVSCLVGLLASQEGALVAAPAGVELCCLLTGGLLASRTGTTHQSPLSGKCTWQPCATTWAAACSTS
jgi:hypothetical protein